MSSQDEYPAQKSRDPVFIGADAAMSRAAERARRRAAEAARAATSGGMENELGEIHWFYYTGHDPRERGPRKTE